MPSNHSYSCSGVASRFSGLGIALLFGIAAGWPESVQAQPFGQWWWEGNVGIAQRLNQSLTNGESIGTSDSRQAGLSFLMHGYLGHPAIGKFDLGLSAALSDLKGTPNLGTRGGSLFLDLLPLGKYTFSLGLSHSLWESPSADSDDALLFGNIPDTQTNLHAGVRARRGLLRGLRFNWFMRRLDYLDPTVDEWISETYRADWARSGKFQTSAALEARQEDFGTGGLVTGTYLANYNQRGPITPNWRWFFFGTGISRTIDNPAVTKQQIDNARLSNQLQRRMRGGDLLLLSATYSVSGLQELAAQGFGLSASYLWQVKPSLLVTPRTSYSQSLADGESASSQSGGVGVTYTRRLWVVNSRFAGNVDYSQAQGQYGLAYGVSGSFSHSGPMALGKSLEIELSRNQLSFEQEPVFELPDLGLVPEAITLQNRVRVRLGVSRRWDSRSLGGNVSWARSESSGLSGTGLQQNESNSATIEYLSRLTVRANFSESTLKRGLVEQSVLNYSARVGWSPWRFMSFGFGARRDTRNLFQIGTIDNDRVETNLGIQYGLVQFGVSAWLSVTRPEDGSERTNRGISWSVSRRFAGWLPIVTGTRRRGYIR